MQGVERVEELLLRRLLAGKKLDVVNQEHVDLAVTVAELRGTVVLQRDNELVGKLFARRVDHVRGDVILNDAMPNSVHEVCLPQADAAVEEERIVGMGGRAGHGLCSRVREAVGVADDKLFKSITCIKIRVAEVFKRAWGKERPGSSRIA